jgi:tetratricopeptide (TPR) repeat protein
MTLLKIAAALALATLCPSAWAEPPSSNERPDALFQAAKELRNAGLYSQACPMFAEVQRLAPGVGINLYLGDCYEHIGRIEDARAEFHSAEVLASQTNDKRIDIARARERALEAKPKAIPTPAQGSQSTTETTVETSKRTWTPTRTEAEVGLLGAAATGIGVGAVLLAEKNHAIVEGRDGSSLGTASGIAFAASGAAVVSSILLYLTAPNDNQTAWHITPAPMLAGAGAFVGKRF